MLTSSDIVQLTWPISRSERKTEQKINVVHSLMKQTIMSRFPHNFSTCFRHFLWMSFTVWGWFHHIILFFSCSSNPLQQFNGFWVASCRNWSGWKRLLIFLSVDFLTFAWEDFGLIRTETWLIMAWSGRQELWDPQSKVWMVSGRRVSEAI